MSSATKKKHVAAEVLDSFDVLPDPDKGQMIVQLAAPRGNNLHEVRHPNPEEPNFLVSMPNKFRKSVWVKRGDFVVISPIEEGDKVKGEIIRVLYKEQIKYIKKEGLWPLRFQEQQQQPQPHIEDELLSNPNRPVHTFATKEVESSSDSESE